MGAFNIGVTTVITNDATYIHESFSTVGFGTTENKKITASDGAQADQFGYSVAVGCGKIVVSAPLDDDNGTDSGSAYIFDLYGNQQTKITASDGAAGDNFGYSVAVGSGRIVVGARFGDVGANSNQGSAYIYDLYGYQIAKITASDGAVADQFGISVAVGCGRIVVGASNDDDAGTSSGSAYIFDLNGTQLAKITASDGATNNFFGSSVAVGNGRIVVGAPDVIGIGGAYIFDLNGTQLAKITAFDGGATNRFGRSVAVGNGRIVVGAYNSEAAYIFDLNGTLITKITASDPGNDDFGYSVAVGCGKIIVGAYNDNVTFNGQGSAYIFDLNGTELLKIIASVPGTTDQFGHSVAVGSGRIVAGALRDDDNGTDSGAAYIYNLPEDSNIYWERILDTYKY